MKSEEKIMRILTIEKYIECGRMVRVVIRSYSRRNLIDLPVRSTLSRIFLLCIIPAIKFYSLFLNDMNVSIIKSTSDNLL
jgi:hypothetical protein